MLTPSAPPPGRTGTLSGCFRPGQAGAIPAKHPTPSRSTSRCTLVTDGPLDVHSKAQPWIKEIKASHNLKHMGKRHSQKVNMPPPPRSTRPQERQMQYGPDPASAANQYHRDEENVQHSASQPRQDPRIPSRPANNNSRSAGHNRRNNKDTNKDQTWFDQNNTAIPVPQLSTDGKT